MKGIHVIMILFLLLSACSDSDVEERYYSDWYDTSMLSPGDKEMAENFRSEPIPLINEVSIPKYPDAKLLIVNPQIDNFSGLLLVSKHTPDEITNWYRSKLPNYSYFTIELGNLFIEGEIDKFNYREDSLLFLEKEHVIVSPTNKTKLHLITPGYETMIDISYRVK